MSVHPPGRRPEGGFGLIELIVVLVIVAILMAVIVPSFLNQKHTTLNRSTIASAQMFELAAVEYQRSFPYVGHEDRLFSRNGSTAPFAKTSKPEHGLYGVAGDPLVKNWPGNPYSRKPVVVLRSPGCNAAPSLGDVMLCRPVVDGSPDYLNVRLVAWGRNREKQTVVVYDTTTCGGPCNLS